MWQIPRVGKAQGPHKMVLNKRFTSFYCVTLRKQLGRSVAPIMPISGLVSWYPGTACVPGRQDAWGNSWAGNPPVESHSFIFQPHLSSKKCNFPKNKTFDNAYDKRLPIFGGGLSYELVSTGKWKDPSDHLFWKEHWSEKSEKISSLVGTVIWEIWPPLMLVMPWENPVQYELNLSFGDLALSETLVVEGHMGSKSSTEKSAKFSFEGGTVICSSGGDWWRVRIRSNEPPSPTYWGIWLNRSERCGTPETCWNHPG